jgi:hypothetical protein
MRNEPLYGLPVEEPGDIEGWSINADLGGDLLAVAIAAELSRIESNYNAIVATLGALPMNIQAGRVAMVRAVFRLKNDPMYNTAGWLGSESVVFERPFDSPPSVVLIPQLITFPGEVVEVGAFNVTESGFTGVLFADNPPANQYTSGWIAVERTQA